MARKIIGITFIIAAIFGLIFSIAGIALVWGVKAPLTENVLNAIDLVDTTLGATSSGLVVLDDTLSKTISDLTTLEDAMQTASSTVDNAVPMVETLSELLSGNIPKSIEATQTGINTLKDAAGTVESTLALLTSIPFLPIEKYDPEVPLTIALDEVSQSLDAIPESLKDMSDTLNTTQINLIMLAAQVRIISRDVSGLKSTMNDLQLVLEQYQEVISTAQEKVASFHSNLSTIITVTAWIFTIIFIWLGIAQIGLLTQGLERVDWPRPPRTGGEEETPELEPESDDSLPASNLESIPDNDTSSPDPKEESSEE